MNGFKIQNICLLFLFQLAQIHGYSQKGMEGNTPDHDTLFVQTFPKSITTSIFLSQGLANLDLTDNMESATLYYEPNAPLGLGASVSAKWLTVSFSYGFKFLNPDEQQGETKSFDFQTHIYTRKFVIDLFAEFFKGMYLDNTLELQPDFPKPYYVRPDFDEEILGASGYYIFNHERFSFPAALVQSERQLRSAGSFLLGFEMYAGRIRADSALVPYFLREDVLRQINGFDELSFLKVGPSAGYAYTLVIAKKIYLTAALSVNFNIGESRTHHVTDGQVTRFKADIGAFGRFGIGYNTDKWCFSINSIYNNLATQSEKEVPSADYGISQVRINLIHRFDLGAKLESHIDKVRVPFVN